MLKLNALCVFVDAEDCLALVDFFSKKIQRTSLNSSWMRSVPLYINQRQIVVNGRGGVCCLHRTIETARMRKFLPSLCCFNCFIVYVFNLVYSGQWVKYLTFTQNALIGLKYQHDQYNSDKTIISVWHHLILYCSIIISNSKFWNTMDVSNWVGSTDLFYEKYMYMVLPWYLESLDILIILSIPMNFKHQLVFKVVYQKACLKWLSLVI